jgi:predicted dehydrogenase
LLRFAVFRAVKVLIRLGLIGLGHMGLLHLRNTRFFNDVKVVAVSDKIQKHLDEAKSYGVTNTYADYRDLLKEDLEAVVISLPTYLHEESIVLSAEKGLHVFVEKPLARNLPECKAISHAVSNAGTILNVGHNYRFFDHVQKLKNKLDTGSIGEVEIANLAHFVNGPFAHPLDPVPVQEWWLDSKLSGGGVLLDQGSHMIDLFRYFFSDAKPLFCNLGYRYALEVEDSALLALRAEKTSTKGLISVGWFQKMFFPKFNFRVDLQGTFGMASTESFGPKNMYSHAAKEALKNIGRKIVNKKIEPLSYTYYYASYFKELQGFFENVKKSGYVSDCATLNDGVEAIAVIEEAYKTANREDLH